MRRLPRPGTIPATLLASILTLSVAACSRSGLTTPEARLGSDITRGDARKGPQRTSTAVRGSIDDFRSMQNDVVYFASDSSELTVEAKAALQTQARWLTQYATHAITIEGHADERGTREFNIALGARRAEAVRGFLVAQGVAPSRLRVLSFGKERPVIVCDDISCWARNRRTHTVLNTRPGSPT